MNSKKIIIGIHTCNKNNSRIDRIKDLFLDNLKQTYKVYFVYGNSKQNNIINDTIHLTAEDRYEYLPYKTIEFLKVVNEMFDYDYIIKLDDDIFINIDNFNKFIDNLKEVDYCGFFLGKKALKGTPRTYHFNKCSNEHFNKVAYEPFDYEFCDGACCLLSRKAVKIILDNYSNNHEYLECKRERKGSEDRMIGQILTYSADVKIVKNGRWLHEGTNLWSTFNNGLYHPVDFTKLPTRMTVLDKKFILKYLIKQ